MKVTDYLKNFPSVAIVGSRQCGKSTFAKHLIKDFRKSLYLDMENPDDLAKLNEPTLFIQQYPDTLICLDEIQRKPDIFPVLRSVIDGNDRNGQFLFLGSASPDLLKQSSESLAGRIIYQELTPFLVSELPISEADPLFKDYWLRGGFPRSYLASNDALSFRWRKEFIKTFLERDISNLGINYPPQTMERLWRMISHSQGQVVNMSQLGNSLGVSHTMARNYLDILQQTFMIRALAPWSGNLKKRLIKSPKIYIRDSGILHALQNIQDLNSLLGHPLAGASWETMVIENILNNIEDCEASYYRTSTGNEIDLVLQKNGKTYAIEIKLSSAPKLNTGFFKALEDLNAKKAWIIAPVEHSYPLKENVIVSPLIDFLTLMDEL